MMLALIDMEGVITTASGIDRFVMFSIFEGAPEG
jgi:hypothetical protein